jgi:hypothetical protein
MKGWLDNFGKADNANDSNVSLPEGFVGLGYNTKGRNYSPAWGGQFQGGGKLIPVSPMQQITGETPTISPTVPYLQTKDPAEFYKSWIQSPEYERRLKSTGYSDVPNKQRVDELSQIEQVKKERLGLLENIQPLEYDPSKRSEAIIDYYDGSTINVNPSDYKTFSKQSVEAHEIAHVATPTSTMSNDEFGIFMGSKLPLKKPIVSGVQGSKEREASIEAAGDFEHLGKPWEAKADLDALRFMMYDKGIYDITKGKKFTESDFEKVKQSFGKERVFKRFTDRMGKENFVKLMNTIAKADGDEELPMAMGGMSIPGSVGFTYARTAGSAPSKGKYAKKTMASAQNGIMSPLLLGRKILEYIYPSEEATATVEAAPTNYKKGLTNELLQRQAYKESTFNPAAVSPAGYKGLTQIGEGVLKDYSNKKGGKKLDPFNPKDAVELQKFAMDDLYNASFINKPEQSDSVRIAKTLAAYNWGRGNLSNYLNEQKDKGVDIYGSYDWLNNLPKETSDYVNKILLQEDPSFNKNYKKASTNPKYEEVTSLYNQKKFGGDIPSAQNGQEMKFYQNGLDWKPKSMQDGGEKMYQGLELPEFVVEGKDERMKEAMSKGMANFYRYVGELMGAPQKEMMQLVTGKEQTPSEAFGFQNPGGWLDSYSSFGKNLGNFAMDAVLDPVNLIGAGVADDIIKTGAKAFSKKMVPNNTPFGSTSSSVENIFTSIPKKFIEEMRFDNLPELNNPNATQVLENFRKRIQTPEGRKRLKDLGITNKKVLDDLKIVADENTLGHYWRGKIGLHPELPEVKKVTRHEIEHAVQNSIKNSRMDKVDKDRIKFKYFLRPDAEEKAIEAAMKPTSEIDDMLSGLQLRKTPEKVDWDEIKSTRGKLDPSQLFNYFSNKQKATNYFDSGSRGQEKSAFLSEVQQYMMDKGTIPSDSYSKITPEMVKETFIDAMFDEKGGKYLRLFNIMKPNDTNYKLVSDALNKMLTVAPVAGGATAVTSALQNNQPAQKQKNGGITKDNQGYWNTENWGKPVEIDSNDITMEPSPYTGVEVPYNVLGVSDTGDTKLMKPGKNYKFKGKKVREYPVAKLGINQLDAQPMKKLNQLLNFTNNPDKDNWLDKYN